MINQTSINPYVALADADIALDKARKALAINPCPSTLAACNDAKDDYEKAYVGYSKANQSDIKIERGST